ncbi:MAG: pyridoxamine 5'-phosphate oxidase [Verrucomicrobiales bacterium]
MQPPFTAKDGDLSSLRRDYGHEREPLKEAGLPDCPFQFFDQWLQAAVDFPCLEPNAMTLATALPNGVVNARTVLLKFFNTKGFTFFTNKRSTKAKEIHSNPHVALVFNWLALERQVIVQGEAQELSFFEASKYFLSRPRESQLGAWVSNQSETIPSRSILETRLRDLQRAFPVGKIPMPNQWGGYRVVPNRIEFWQGGSGRIHDRFEYTPDEDRLWTKRRLSP